MFIDINIVVVVVIFDVVVVVDVIVVHLLFTDDALEALVVPLPRFVLHLFHARPERLAASVTPEQK